MMPTSQAAHVSIASWFTKFDENSSYHWLNHPINTFSSWLVLWWTVVLHYPSHQCFQEHFYTQKHNFNGEISLPSDENTQQPIPQHCSVRVKPELCIEIHCRTWPREQVKYICYIYLYMYIYIYIYYVYISLETCQRIGSRLVYTNSS